jgi:isoleucyl-tRNA synthetase
MTPSNLPTAPDWPALEEEVLAYWDKEKVFEVLRARNEGGPTFSFLDGPMTANNPMGVHHAWGRTLKDLYQRYKALQGFDQRYQNGFDCQGLWVEVEVEKELGLADKRAVEEYGLDRFAEACRARVAKYGEVQTEQSKRLGMWMDWGNDYHTFSDTNNEYNWKFLKEMHERDALYQGERVMPWCPRCGTSLSQHEQAGSHASLTHETAYVAFSLTESDDKLVVWTTQPYTLLANASVAVNPSETYVRLRTSDGVFVVAEARLPFLPFNGEVLASFPGSSLVGKTYTPPFSLQRATGAAYSIVAWDEVTLSEGTGLVHLAPTCGEEDFEVAGREGFSAEPLLDEAGRVLEGYGDYAGQSAEEATNRVLENLSTLVHREPLTHSFPTCWRCKSELVFRLVKEWFLSVGALRSELRSAASNVTWNPPSVGKRMDDWLVNMDDWCVSRRRYFGLPLPFFPCTHCDTLTVVGSRKELEELAVSGLEQLQELHRPWVDNLVLRCKSCGAEDLKRVPDVGDAWLDAGVVPLSTLGFEQRERVSEGYATGAAKGLSRADLPSHSYWEKWFPADFVCEMREQTRLWFYATLFMSVVFTGRAPYRSVLSYEKVSDEEGKPMHKSTGNALSTEEVFESAGADPTRWLYLRQDPSRPLRFGHDALKDMQRRLLPLWNSVSLFLVSSEMAHFTPGASTTEPLDEWLASRVALLREEVTTSLDTYDHHRAASALEDFVSNDLSGWYLRASRERLKEGSGLDALYSSLKTLLQLLSPFLPFTSEYLWEKLTNPFSSTPTSVFLEEWPKSAQYDQLLLEEMDSVRRFVELGFRARAKMNMRQRQPLSLALLSAPSSLLERWGHLVAAQLNVQRVEKASDDVLSSKVRLNFKLVGPRLGKKMGEMTKALEAGNYSVEGDTLHLCGETLSGEEFSLTLTSAEGYELVSENGEYLLLDTRLTPELVKEGLLRDGVRGVQEARKSLGCRAGERVALSVGRSSNLGLLLEGLDLEELSRLTLTSLALSEGEEVELTS